MVELFWLIIIVGAVALIGYGIWVVVAAIFRAVFGGTETKPVALQTRCVACGAALRLGDDFCSACGRHQNLSAEMSLLAELAVAARQLDRLLNQGKLNVVAHRAAMKAINEERERLIRPTRPAPTVQTPPPVVKTEPATQPTPARPITAEPVPASEPPPVFSRVEAVIRHESEPPIPAAPVQVEPRRSLTEMLETFMEESSIRWGELIGGLLIIGCSLALVISLWSQITGVPLLKFSVFVGMTAGLFGMGFYSAHRWRLPTTSRGALVISTLLVPLNFLAMTAFSQSSAPNSAVILVGEAFALALFLFLVYQAGKVITPGKAWMLAGATLAPSFAMLSAKHWQTASAPLLFLGIAPLLAYWASTGLMLRGVADDTEDNEADQMFTLFGIVSFAVLSPVGLLLLKSGSLTNSRMLFAPLIALLGVPAVACGLTLRRAKSGKTKTVAVSVALLGLLVSLAGLLLAWPSAKAVIATALILCAVSAGVAWRFRLKTAHVAALVFFALAYLTGCNVAAGNYTLWSEDGLQLVRSLFSNAGGLAWLSLFALFGAAAEVWRRYARRTESRIYEVAAAASALFSLLLLTWHGFGRAGDPRQLALVYGFYAAALFAVAWIRDWFLAAWIGLTLALFSIVQTFVYKFGYTFAPYHPTRLALLVYASLATVAAVTVRNSGGKTRRIFGWPLTAAALIASVAVAPLLLVGGWMTVGQLAARMFWLCAIWLALSVAKRQVLLFAAFQVALTLAVLCSVATYFDSTALPSRSSWLDPHALQAQGVALALLSLSWLLLRIGVRRFVGDNGGLVLNLLYPGWPMVDRVTTFLAWGILCALSVGSVLGFSENAVRARGFGAWILLAGLMAVFIVSLWERFSKRAVLALMTLPACACLLSAGEFQPMAKPWLSLRWLLAIGFAITALPILFRAQLQQACARFRWPQREEQANGLARMSHMASLALYALPTLALTVIVFSVKWITADYSFAGTLILLTPLFLLSLTLAAHALRERSSAYAFFSGLLLNLAATFGCLLANERLITTIQANVIVMSLVSLVWLGVWRRFGKARQALVGLPEIPENTDEPKLFPPAILQWQIDLLLCAGLALLAVADLRLVLSPQIPSAMTAAMGGVWGWLAGLLPVAAWLGSRGWRLEQFSAEHLGIALLAAASLATCSFSRVASAWAAYHALMVGVAVSAGLMLMFHWKREALAVRFASVEAAAEGGSVVWATLLGFLQLTLLLRGLEAPNDVLWTAGAGAAICLLFTILAVATRHRGYLYLAGLLCNLMVSRLLIWGDDALFSYRKVVFGNLIALCLSSLVWLKLDLAVMRRGPSANMVPIHRVAARFAMLIMTLAAIYHWAMNIFDLQQGSVWEWMALASVTALLTACLWDQETDLSWRGLYGIGLIAIAYALAELPFSNQALHAGTAAAFALFALTATLLWQRPEIFTRLAESLRLPQRHGLHERIANWLVNANVVLTLFVTFSNLLAVFSFPSPKLRLLTATAAFALPIAFAVLVRSAKNLRLITVSTRLILMNLIVWSWAWLSPESMGQMVNRFVILMVVAECVLICYRFLVMNRLAADNKWRKSLRADLPVVASLGGMALAFVLVAEVSNYLSFGSTLMAWPVVLTTLGTLLGLCVIGLVFAILPSEDPFGWDECRRMRYVYAMEGCVVLTLMHVRLTMPWLFGGRFAPYWPLLVMLLAFGGIALSEVFSRQGKLVLAEPLGRTGILLPLLPVIGFWVLNSQISYSALLLLAGLFYGCLSVMRRSFGFGLLAALAGNGGLWHFLHGSDGYGLSEHPQLWLIPAALSVLLAARINRSSLSAEQHSSIRYCALIVIYVSSTADIFLNGVDGSPWLPMALAALSVGGVMAGLVLRIRPFLFLGTVFLLLSILTMIWSASVNLQWTWLWYVTGIALGVFILYSLAVFERRREEMLRFVERLRQWQ